MTLVGLIILIALVCLLVWLGQQLPPPWQIICIAVAVLLVIVAALSVLGLDFPIRSAHAFIAQ